MDQFLSDNTERLQTGDDIHQDKQTADDKPNAIPSVME